MDIQYFYALHTGPATQLDGQPASLRVLPLGDIQLPSGQVQACDPFVMLGDGPIFATPQGSFPVYATIADVSNEQNGSHERVAYLSVVFAEEAAAKVAYAESTEEAAPEGMFYGVDVDAGTVSFIDHAVVPENVYDICDTEDWFDPMDSEDHLEDGVANIPVAFAHNNENIVLSHSGWGDGTYPVLATYNAAGTLLALHIDLYVVGEVATEFVKES
ncbi:DUF4241 domain-containing protein [Timonella sp. A28]|uniref:DUF4241 domain-containing protein n=1 Tax=Timonella sp. A28 TaxID=3442640 RepID=UPI003EBF6D40